MKLGEIYVLLDVKSPFALAESWDNSGILIGRRDSDVSKIVLSLDASLDVVQNAPQGSLIITHHPFIFSAIKTIDLDSTVGKIIHEAIKKDISIISMHTNYDKSVMNSYFVSEILGFDSFLQDEFICKAAVDMSFDELVDLVKTKLGLQNVNCVLPKQSRITSIGITTGSGGEFVFDSGCDVFLTGDVKYHTAFEASERGVGIIDVTHYASELCFSESMAKILKILPIEVIITNSKNPFGQY